jgi:hypothetical protein
MKVSDIHALHHLVENFRCFEISCGDKDRGSTALELENGCDHCSRA